MPGDPRLAVTPRESPACLDDNAETRSRRWPLLRAHLDTVTTPLVAQLPIRGAMRRASRSSAKGARGGDDRATRAGDGATPCRISIRDATIEHGGARSLPAVRGSRNTAPDLPPRCADREIRRRISRRGGRSRDEGRQSGTWCGGRCTRCGDGDRRARIEERRSVIAGRGGRKRDAARRSRSRRGDRARSSAIEERVAGPTHTAWRSRSLLGGRETPPWDRHTRRWVLDTRRGDRLRCPTEKPGP